jgi:hypothetical protein
MFSPLPISLSSRFVLLFHSPFSFLGPYIHLNNKVALAFSKTKFLQENLQTFLLGQVVAKPLEVPNKMTLSYTPSQ